MRQDLRVERDREYQEREKDRTLERERDRTSEERGRKDQRMIGERGRG